MEPLLLVLWFFKLPFEPNQLFTCHALSKNPKPGNGRVNGRFSELRWSQTNTIVVKRDGPKSMLTAPDILLSREMVYLQV